MRSFKEYTEDIATPIVDGVFRIKCKCGWHQSATTAKLRSEWVRSHALYHMEQDNPVTRPSSDGWTGD